MENTNDTNCEECVECNYDEAGMNCASSQCNRYFCSDCTKTDDTLTHCSNEDWACPVCSAPQATGEENEEEQVSPSDDTQDATCDKPEAMNFVSDIRRLSRGLMSIKNKLREATSSVIHGGDRQDTHEGPKADAKTRIKTLEKRIREIELMRYTVIELRKLLNTQSYSYVLNSIEVSLDTTMKIFCALHIMQQKK